MEEVEEEEAGEDGKERRGEKERRKEGEERREWERRGRDIYLGPDYGSSRGYIGQVGFDAVGGVDGGVVEDISRR